MSRIEPDDPSFDPAAWEAGDEGKHLARGIDLFNAGEYEEAHEEFEILWLSTQGPDSDFYKGLVQAAIALHHLRRGNVDGAAKLYASHRRYLAAYLPAHKRIDVQALLEQLQAVLRPVARRESTVEQRFDLENRPRLRVL